ncbi:hypothetical protein BOX15_Mlig006029g3, partial [Macrostomum lignano]
FAHVSAASGMGSAESTSQDERSRVVSDAIGNNKDTLISLDLNAKQLWERLNGLSENLDSSLSLYPLRHSGGRHQQHQQSATAAYFNSSRGSLRDLVTRCVDIMEGQQQALAAKDAQIAQLQAQLASALCSKPAGRQGPQQSKHQKLLAKQRRLAKAAATRRAKKLNNELASLTAPSIHDEKSALARRYPALPIVLPAVQPQQLLAASAPAEQQQPGRQLRTPQRQQQAQNLGGQPTQKRIKLTRGAGTSASRPAQVSIETPSWRICPPTKATYKLEGTEDLSDKHYESLHTRQEADERRRKLWDLRAQRERAYYDRLKQKALQRAANAAAAVAAAEQSGKSAETASDGADAAADSETKELLDNTKVRLVGKPLTDFEQRLAKLTDGAAAVSESPPSSSSVSSLTSSIAAGRRGRGRGRGRRQLQSAVRR